MTIRILLADNDVDFRDVTAYALRRAGFSVNTVADGREALEYWQSEDPDIVLLDVAMHGMPGMQVCQAMRRSSTTPVILISGARKEAEIIRGFEVGADDFLTKPFSIQHLVMRLKAIYRRTGGQGTNLMPKHLEIGPLAIDLDSFDAQVNGKRIQFTRLEFRILYCLAANLGRVVSTSQIIDFGWGFDGEGDGSLLKTHVSHIRRKLKEATDWPISIRAFPSVGYSMDIDPQEASHDSDDETADQEHAEE